MHHHWIYFAVKLLCFCAIIILLVVLFRQWLRHRERQWAFILKQDNNKSLAPLKITAYERLVVMLERISPQSLVLRHSSHAASAGMLQLELIRSIREEFEHNVSLQMYVSIECWEKISKAKDETSELVKIAFTRVRPESTAMDLTREIINLDAKVGNSAVKDALLAIRIEMARYF